MPTLLAPTSLTKAELDHLRGIYDTMSHSVSKQLQKLGQRQWGAARHEPGIPQLTTFRSKPQFEVLDAFDGLEEVIDHRFQWAVRSISSNGKFSFWAVMLVGGQDPSDDEGINYLVRSMSRQQPCNHRTLGETLEQAFQDGPLTAGITVGVLDEPC